MIHHRRDRAIGRGGRRDLLVELGDLAHRDVGLRDRIGNAELGVTAQGLDIVAHLVEMLGQQLGRADHRRARRGIVGTGR